MLLVSVGREIGFFFFKCLFIRLFNKFVLGVYYSLSLMVGSKDKKENI